VKNKKPLALQVYRLKGARGYSRGTTLFTDKKSASHQVNQP